MHAQEEREDPSAASEPEWRPSGASGRVGEEGAFRTSGPKADPAHVGPAERPVHAFPLRPRGGPSQPFSRQFGRGGGSAGGIAGAAARRETRPIHRARSHLAARPSRRGEDHGGKAARGKTPAPVLRARSADRGRGGSGPVGDFRLSWGGLLPATGAIGFYSC